MFLFYVHSFECHGHFFCRFLAIFHLHFFLRTQLAFFCRYDMILIITEKKKTGDKDVALETILIEPENWLTTGCGFSKRCT